MIDVSGKEFVAPFVEQRLDAANIARNRTQLKWCAEHGLAELLTVRVDQCRSEVFRFPDDAGVGHSG